MNHILTIVVLFFCSHYSLACQYSANSNELKDAQEDRAKMKALVADLALLADSIFIGSVSSKTKNSFTFVDIVNLKGETKEGSEFRWEQKLDEFIIGCSGVTNINQLYIPDEDFEMGSLVYVKDKKILRMNLVGSFADEPSGYEEVEWLSN